MTTTYGKLINFYLGNDVDHRGRKIEEIWLWNNEKLESSHDYIQWLFPLKEKSNFNIYAPVLSNEDIMRFKDSENLQHRLLTSFDLL